MIDDEIQHLIGLSLSIHGGGLAGARLLEKLPAILRTAAETIENGSLGYDNTPITFGGLVVGQLRAEARMDLSAEGKAWHAKRAAENEMEG